MVPGGGVLLVMARFFAYHNSLWLTLDTIDKIAQATTRHPANTTIMILDFALSAPEARGITHHNGTTCASMVAIPDLYLGKSPTPQIFELPTLFFN
jgi:hypothetical protein